MALFKTRHSLSSSFKGWMLFAAAAFLSLLHSLKISAHHCPSVRGVKFTLSYWTTKDKQQLCVLLKVPASIYEHKSGR